MFVYSMRASTLKFFGVIILSVITLIVLIVFIPTYDSNTSSMGASAAYPDKENINFSGIKTNDDRVKFLSQFGWQVSGEALEEQDVTLPGEFDRVLSNYNELQKQQGLDLSKYTRKTVTRYTYQITNYPGYTGTVYANILVYRSKVVGGDICSSDVNGFVHGFRK